MGKILGIGSKFMNVMNRVADILLLNFLFLVTSIPIITTGASLTALYSVMMKVCVDEEGYIIKDYCRIFRKNFKKAVCLWGMFLGIAVVIGIDAYFYIFSAESVFLMRYLFYILLICFIFVLSYSFVVLGQMNCTVGRVLKNSAFLSIRFLPYTMVIVLCNLSGIIMVMFFPGILPYIILAGLLIGFSATAYINSFFFNKIFRIRNER